MGAYFCWFFLNMLKVVTQILKFLPSIFDFFLFKQNERKTLRKYLLIIEVWSLDENEDNKREGFVMLSALWCYVLHIILSEFSSHLTLSSCVCWIEMMFIVYRANTVFFCDWGKMKIDFIVLRPQGFFSWYIKKRFCNLTYWP